MSHKSHMGILLTPRPLRSSVQLRGTQKHTREGAEVCHASDFIRIEQICSYAAWVVHVSKDVQGRRSRDDNRRPLHAG